MKPGTYLVFFLLEEEKEMKPLLQKFYFLIVLLFIAGLTQEVQAQKERFFNQFHWNKEYYAPAGSGAQGFALNSLYRNYNDTANYYLGFAIPVQKINSSFGFYYLHNTANQQQRLETGLSYTAFLPVGQSGSLHLGVQANRYQQATSERNWAFGEYQTERIEYTTDASLFFQQGKLGAGFSADRLFRQGQLKKPDYTLFLSFRELRTTHWLLSSPSLLLQVREEQGLPEWRYNYTATIANFLMLGGSYYRNSDYLYGFNAGFKICNTVWLTAATDFENLLLPYRALYEFGLRINIPGRHRNGAFATQAEAPEEELEAGF